MNKRYSPILIMTALPFESRIILNYHNINIKPKKLTTYQLQEWVYLIEVPIGFKFDPSILDRTLEKIVPTLIINFGICGALDSSIPIGSAFQIKKVGHHDRKLSEIQLPTIKIPFKSESLLTVDEPVLNAIHRDELHSQTGCRLVDMESYHLARYCEANRLPLLIVKITSDFANEESLVIIKANRSEIKRALANAYETLIAGLSW